MIGAIIGDIVGSRFEFNNTNSLNFKLFTSECNFTDDTICTIAIADAILKKKDYKTSLLEWCRKYPNPMGAYGGSFARWIHSSNPQPYNSFGNGSAMRVSPTGWAFDNKEDVILQAEQTARPTHNHPEGIKRAIATALSIFYGRKFGKEYMLSAIKEYYPQFVEPICGGNNFNETCQGTLPICFGIIDKTRNFEEAIRYAIAVGGDSDTIGAIVGSIAEAIYGVPQHIYNKALEYLPKEMQNVIEKFYIRFNIDHSCLEPLIKLNLTQEDLLRYCRYYTGENECPSYKNALFWDYEKRWIELMIENNMLLNEMISVYISNSLKDFERTDNTPISLKSLLFNRYSHWLREDADGFKKWYKSEYINK